MINEDLIKKLKKLPPKMKVMLIDLDRNQAFAEDEPSHEGVYTDFEVALAYSDDELEYMKEQHNIEENRIVISFEPTTDPRLEECREILKTLADAISSRSGDFEEELQDAVDYINKEVI